MRRPEYTEIEVGEIEPGRASVEASNGAQMRYTPNPFSVVYELATSELQMCLLVLVLITFKFPQGTAR